MSGHVAKALLLGCTLSTAPLAQAAEYHVGNRQPAALAAAIRDANASPGADTIHLAADGLYSFSEAVEDDLVLPRIAGELRIEGHGAELRRNSAEPLALLEIVAGARVAIARLTLAEGGRGSIRNHGTLELTDSAVVDGTTQHESAIVQNYGRLVAERSVIGFNQVAGAGRDAAIVVNYGTLTLGDCRLAGNSLARRWPTLAAAPLINFGELRMVRSAFEDNAVIDGFEGLASDGLLNLGIGRLAAD